MLTLFSGQLTCQGGHTCPVNGTPDSFLGIEYSTSVLYRVNWKPKNLQLWKEEHKTSLRISTCARDIWTLEQFLQSGKSCSVDLPSVADCWNGTLYCIDIVGRPGNNQWAPLPHSTQFRAKIKIHIIICTIYAISCLQCLGNKKREWMRERRGL